MLWKLKLLVIFKFGEKAVGFFGVDRGERLKERKRLVEKK